MINCKIFILNSNQVQSLQTKQQQQKLIKWEVSCYSHTLQGSKLQDLSLTRTEITLNTLEHTGLHYFTHFWTLEHTLKHTWIHFESQLNSWTLENTWGLLTVFFSSIYTFLEQQFLQLNSYFLHFEFQIIKRSGSISNSNFLGDDNTYHMSF